MSILAIFGVFLYFVSAKKIKHRCNRTGDPDTLFDLDSTNFSKLYLFKNTTVLGKIHQTIDWDSLEKLLPQKATIVGAPSWLPSRGLFALMFLKHYTGLSDEKLLEDFHTNWAMQMFCGTLLSDNERIKDNSFVSRVRSYLGNHLDLNLFQSVMINSWKAEIPDKNVLLMDATCYEVYLRIPTDSDRRCGQTTLGSLHLALGKTDSNIMYK